MKIIAYICPCCKDAIYSRARHDFRYCSCEKLFVDGGFDYVRLGCDPKLGEIKTVTIEVDATKQELYRDWNHSIDKFGLLKEAELSKLPDELFEMGENDG